MSTDAGSTATTVVPAAAPPGDDTARATPVHVEEIRTVAALMRDDAADPEQVGVEWLDELAALLDGAADREVEYLADAIHDTAPPRPPLPGEEVWFAWAVARAWLAEAMPDG